MNTIIYLDMKHLSGSHKEHLPAHSVLNQKLIPLLRDEDTTFYHFLEIRAGAMMTVGEYQCALFGRKSMAMM